MSNESFKVKNGLTLIPVSLTTLTNPQAGDLACDINESNKIKRYDATAAAWVEVGSGSGSAGYASSDITATNNVDWSLGTTFRQTNAAFPSQNFTFSNTVSGKEIAVVCDYVNSGNEITFPAISSDTFNNNLPNTINTIIRTSATQSDGSVIIAGGDGSGFITRVNKYGVVDATFAANTIGKFNNEIRKVIIQPDGRILVAGFFSYLGVSGLAGLVRLFANGTRDTTFSPPLNAITAHDIALQSNGQILVGLEEYYHGPSDTLVGLIRLNSNGTIDASFTSQMPEILPGYGERIIVQSDQKILVTYAISAPENLTVRYNSNGTLDTTFSAPSFTGPAGIVYPSVSALQSDGKIIATIPGGYSIGGRNSIIRLNSDGTTDSTFNANPFLTNSPVYKTAVQLDGKIVITGATGFYGIGDYLITRLNSNGTRDTTFNSESMGEMYENGLSLEIQTSGKILLGGDIYNTLLPKTYFFRLLENGEYDRSFTYQKVSTIAVFYFVKIFDKIYHTLTKAIN